MSPATDTFASPPTHRFAFATPEGMAEQDRLDYWRQAVCENIVDLDFAPHADSTFHASAAVIRLTEVAVSRIRASAHDVTHVAPRSSNNLEERLVLNFILSGHVLVQQDGREVLIGAGDGALCQAAHPYALRSDQPFELACITLTRDAVLSRAANVSRLTATSLARASELSGIVFGYVSGLATSTIALNPLNTAKIGHHFKDLLAAMLNEALPNSPLPLSEYRMAALIRVKDFVERHQTDPSLDTASIAAALKLSPRYINQLLEAEGTSLSRYIWRRRVERAAADLRNPALQGRNVTLIAMANGFNDLGHFSRSFRQRFDVSPRAYRDASTAPR
ncbi:helix-turn-helix domain-containing protein [Variovorax sp. J31P179]|uniref:AraC-like ligand-binding domain-containing protein n=1 Tax=Variovorax sp. J31P179 TaxID=3053508 RepID=UPI002577D998|nr:helix-turn-helix domain-containing protein [Variovorax sp. J31P179]MDM0085412.1 helix-turn-helix domain-containing protein [Variovorax sp. J31P179]